MPWWGWALVAWCVGSVLLAVGFSAVRTRDKRIEAELARQAKIRALEGDRLVRDPRSGVFPPEHKKPPA